MRTPCEHGSRQTVFHRGKPGGGEDDGPTGTSNAEYWYDDAIALDFDVGMVMEAELKIISSSYDPFPRAGYALCARDASNRFFGVSIASDRIFILRTNQGSTGTKAFDSTDAYHHYRFVVSEGFGRLYIDHGPDPFLSLAVGSPFGSAPNQVGFGDGTGLATSESLLKSFSYQSIPEPSILCMLGGLLAAGGSALLVRRRRKRESRRSPKAVRCVERTIPYMLWCVPRTLLFSRRARQ